MPDKRSAEAVRLRADGLSLRAIAEQVGVNEKQVRRWLQAAGANKPTKVKGLDGRTYRKMSAVDSEGSLSADGDLGALRLDTKILIDTTYEVQLLKSALVAEYCQLRNGCRGRLPVDEAKEAGRAACIEVLAKGRYYRYGSGKTITRLWDKTPEDGESPSARLGCLLSQLAELLTPESLEVLRGDIDDLLVRSRQGTISTADTKPKHRTKVENIRHTIATYAMRTGEELKRGLPTLVREAHSSGCWREAKNPAGKSFGTFIDWLKTPSSSGGCGLGSTPDAITYAELLAICEKVAPDVAKVLTEKTR
jgi:hypothetical protein